MSGERNNPFEKVYGPIKDVNAYLNRIGFDGKVIPSIDCLKKLMHCHLMTVPFENLDVFHGHKEPSLEVDVMFEKIVIKRRGGYCFELNGLFSKLLEAVGFSVSSSIARIRFGRDFIPPAAHRVITVKIADKSYFCDVGFGGPGPKGALPLDEDPIQTVDGEKFRVKRQGIYVNIQRYHEETWIDTIRYADIPFIREDFTGLLYFASSAPGSHFVSQRIVNLCLPCGGSLALTGNRFTVRRNGEVIQKELTSEGEVSAVLEKEYGIYM